MSDLYRLVYTSRSLMLGDVEQRRREIDHLLEACRDHNRRDGITGALLLGADTFAQILEGARATVETTFERIQCDPRHGQIDVIQCEPVAERMFPDWDMALVGRPEHGRLFWKDLSRDAEFDLSRLDGDTLCSAVLAMIQADGHGAFPSAQELEAEIESRRRLIAVTRRSMSKETASVAAPLPTMTAASVQPIDAGAGVLRAALDEERDRTTALRQELDHTRVALARATSDVEAVGRHRDIWADRSTQLRSSLDVTREALAAAETERDELRTKLATCEAHLDRSRARQDVWVECARALAAVLGSESAQDVAQVRTGSSELERPSLRRAS